MWMRLSAFVVWAAVAASVVAWGLRLGVRATPVPGHASLAVPTPALTGDLTRLFGAPVVEAPAAAPAADARFKLVGVVAPRAGVHGGLALIATDGKPARPWAVGQAVEGELQVISVSHRRVELGSDGRVTVALELPPLPEPSRGVPAGAGAAPMVPPAAGLPAPVPTPAGGLPPSPTPIPVAPGSVVPGIMPQGPTGIVPQPVPSGRPAAGGVVVDTNPHS